MARASRRLARVPAVGLASRQPAGSVTAGGAFGQPAGGFGATKPAFGASPPAAGQPAAGGFGVPLEVFGAPAGGGFGAFGGPLQRRTVPQLPEVLAQARAFSAPLRRRIRGQARWIRASTGGALGRPRPVVWACRGAFGAASTGGAFGAARAVLEPLVLVRSGHNPNASTQRQFAPAPVPRAAQGQTPAGTDNYQTIVAVHELVSRGTAHG